MESGRRGERASSGWKVFGVDDRLWPIKSQNIDLVSRTLSRAYCLGIQLDNVDESQISCAALRALALNSREQLIREQREDPELGHIYRYFENPDDGSVNATICEVQMIACFVKENHDNCNRFLHEFSFALRTAVDETTGKTPAELLLGRKIITPFRKLISVTDGAEYVGGNIEKLFDEARQNMRKQHKTWGKYYNRKRREGNIKVNDLVLVQTHFVSAAGRRVVEKFMPKPERPGQQVAKKYSASEGRSVWPGKTTTVRPFAYFLKSRFKELKGIPEKQRSTGIYSLPQNSLRRRSLSMEALDRDPADRSA
ncbi:uncharacterized protein TNCV_1514701 [Trichonephila clavipes]|nr:uncharacterized protein TNCV_1514701 [Trichonephila clavipes]